jgi:hypothetical protein
MQIDEIWILAEIPGPHAGSGCRCRQCQQAEALGVAAQEIRRLREKTLLLSIILGDACSMLDDAVQLRDDAVEWFPRIDRLRKLAGKP